MRIFAVANQKGGQGKSSLTFHLAHAGIEAGLRVLVVDVDPQASVSGVSFPPNPAAAPAVTTWRLLSGEFEGLMPEPITEKLSIIRADKRELSLPRWTTDADADAAIRRFATGLKSFSQHFDLCVIDTPGSVALNPPMTAGALTAAHAVVCPVSIGEYEMATLPDLFNLLKAIRSKGYNAKLQMFGLLPSKIKTSDPIERESLASFREQMGNHVLPFTLAERGAVKRAISARVPVWQGAKSGAHRLAAKEWRATCEHLLSKLGEIKV